MKPWELDTWSLNNNKKWLTTQGLHDYMNYMETTYPFRETWEKR